MVIWCLVNFQTKLKNYLEALKWCNELLKRNPEDQKVSQSNIKNSLIFIVDLVWSLLLTVHHG